ncbi:hypothetical protein BD310DRAFT_864148, partial [Dichomitus squalens]
MAVQQGDGNLASTYTYIYTFLVKQEHNKAAYALKKAVKDVVVLKDGVNPEGPSLERIIKEWKELKEKAAGEVSSESSDSDSDDSDSSSEESSSSSDSSDSSDSDSESWIISWAQPLLPRRPRQIQVRMRRPNQHPRKLLLSSLHRRPLLQRPHRQQ